MSNVTPVETQDGKTQDGKTQDGKTEECDTQDGPTQVGESGGPYAAHWEADVLLADGESARLRPLQPEDEEALLAFWDRLSPESQYYRFFAPRAALSESDVHRFVNADHRDRIVLGAFVRADLIAIGEFGRSDPTDAELAFVVADAYHGYGVGGLLLEHLAQIAREVGVTRLIAEVLAENRKMHTTLKAAGYELNAKLSHGSLHFTFPVEPTNVSQAVMAAREHRAEANSMRRIFEARSVAIVGGSARQGSVGRRLLSNVIAGEFTGRVYVVNPGLDSAFGMPSYPSLRDIPDPVDLAVVAVPAERVCAVVEDCAAKGVRAVIVVTMGFAESGPEGRRRQTALVTQCRAAGIRLIGPCALGVVNAAGNSLNASMVDVQPRPGNIGFFCQSGPLSLTSLRMMVDRDLGVSSFVSAGNRADVSGNDLLQYWEQDERTSVILCYLESLGNSHKFSRLARRISGTKPVVAITSGRGSHSTPTTSEEGGADVSAAVTEAMLRQSGVIQVEYLEHLFDVAQLLTEQPLPPGNRLAVVGDSRELTIIASDMATQAGFVTKTSWLGLVGLPAHRYEERLRAAMDDDEVDAVLAVVVPAPVETSEQIGLVREAIASVGDHPTKPLLAVIPQAKSDPRPPRVLDAPRALPVYWSPERAVQALRKAWDYAQWRAQATSVVPILPNVAPEDAEAFLDDLLSATPAGRALTDGEVTLLLGHYGIPLLPSREVDSLDAAVDAAAAFGRDAVLKVTNAGVGEPADQRVWSQIRDANEMAVAWRQLGQTFGDPRAAGIVVQAMGGSGRHMRVTGVEDRSLGPVVSCRFNGEAAEILHDVSYRLPPLTRSDAAAMIRELQLAPLLLGDADRPSTDLSALENLISRVAQLKQDQPDVERLRLDVLAHAEGLSVVGARVHVRRSEPRFDLYSRRLSAPPDGM